MSDKNTEVSINKSRRNILISATAVTAAMAASSVSATSESHQHHGALLNNKLIDAALDCIKKGEACSNHCIALIKQGDNTVADCLDIVGETLAMCSALATLASSQSVHLNALAKVCVDVCKDCERECEVHAHKHTECKACMDACSVCIDECEKLSA
jgi:Cys-rich four helix bundle protein (predicted Tat secretion target)